MAIADPTKLSDFAGFLPATLAAPIFEKARRKSAFMSLARQIPLAGNGVSIPVTSGRMTAGWIDEGAQKPASSGTLALKTMTPKKIAAIAVVSAEVVRANPGSYMNLIRDQVADAFARAFDLAAAHDAGPDGTVGGGPFATYLAQGNKAVELGTTSVANGGVHKDLVSAMAALVNDEDDQGYRYQLTGWAFSPRVEPLLLGSYDTTGNPIFRSDAGALEQSVIDGREAARGSVLGRPALIGEGVDYFSTLGWAGDFSRAVWGTVGGITYDVSTEAPVTIGGSLVSMWERNLIGIRAEAEYGWLVEDPEAFVEITDVQTS